jgi:CRISPR-associated protein Cas2
MTTPHYLVCYDIADNRRRSRVARWLEGHGYRLHESVFECRLRPAAFHRLVQGLQQRIDPRLDRVALYPLCARDQPDIVHLAASRSAQPAGPVVV